MIGTVKHINSKGFAFLSIGAEEDVFLHASCLDKPAQFPSLQIGERIEFELTEFNGRSRARNARILRD
jgi:cold shock CspA family protein